MLNARSGRKAVRKAVQLYGSSSKRWRTGGSICGMRSRLALAALLCWTVHLHAAVGDQRYWAQWRGPEMTGVSKTAKPPLEWSETKNIKWKVEIPGRGSGTPVIWGDKVFVLTAVPAVEN